MASIGDNSMRNHLRACRRRQKRRASSRASSTLSSNTQQQQQSARSHSVQDEPSSATESDSVYLVEDILGERIVKGQKYYKVRWQGFPPEADSWEPEENLSGVLEAIQHYHQRQAEDLSKVSELVKDCPTSCANSPASLPTPPSTPNCCFPVKRLRGASEDRQSGHPPGTESTRKHGPKSRTSGRYEYVPKHELVASKTKYFDDIRDGKIDLSSNDLYSRVKTRRRLTLEAANPTAAATTAGTDSAHNSTSNSVQGDPEPGCENSPMDQLPPAAGSLKHEPTSPASDSMNAGGSFSGFQSTVDSSESEQMKQNMNDQIEMLSESISDMTQCYSIVELETAQDMPRHRSTVDSATQSEDLPPPALTSSCMTGMVATSTSSSYHVKPPSLDVALSPIVVGAGGLGEDHMDCFSNELVERPEISELQSRQSTTVSGHGTDHPGPTVYSLRKLVHDYFQLISYAQRSVPTEATKPDNVDTNALLGSTCLNDDIRSLDDLPRLVNFSSQASIGTREDFLEAIHTQRWSLLASLLPSDQHMSPTSSMSQPKRTREISALWHGNTDSVTPRELLTAALLTGADRPIVLEQLLRAGLDPNELVLDDDDGLQWPLLAYSVRLRRLHAAQALLDAGASPNSAEPGPKCRTALGMAIAAGDVDMATVLILSGANFYEVENGTTALSLIMKLINAHSSSSGPVQLTKLPPLSVAEAQDRRKSLDSDLPPVPPPSPPPGFEIPTVPKSILFNAIIHSASSGPNPSLLTSTPHATNSSASHSHTKWQHTTSPTEEPSRSLGLPSVDSLRRLYDLIAVHHARLSVRVTTLVRNWLTRAGLVQVGLVSPCQWINSRLRTASIRFNWPTHPSHWSKSTTTRPVAPVLLLVHGRVAPPACYDVWMDDDGPCLIDTVRLDDSTEQKALGRAPFVTTLFPLSWDSARLSPVGEPHSVSVTFHPPSGAGSLRPTCIALMIIAVTPDVDQSAAALNDRGVLRPPLSRSALPTSNRTVIGSPPHVYRQRSVS